jgi:hypothetical protein
MAVGLCQSDLMRVSCGCAGSCAAADGGIAWAVGVRAGLVVWMQWTSVGRALAGVAASRGGGQDQPGGGFGGREVQV